MACDGINGTSLSDQSWARWSIAPTSHIGLATTIRTPLPSGEIHMRVGRHGYVGQVRSADGSVHIAAALDPTAGSPAKLAAEICDCPALATARWQGIGHLTRHRSQLGAERVLTVGDACGYVEPFTGQGIAWAIESAIEATSLLIEADTTTGSIRDKWQGRHRRTVARNQLACRAVRYSLRRPRLVDAALHAIELWPGAIDSLISPTFGVA
ncbi:MAG: hypothetical protein JO353_02780 [Phycisphaerae bacterium]|nr:hypothetical protein [Phycisphaerae bacterium]